MNPRKPTQDEILQSARNVASNICAFAETVQQRGETMADNMEAIDYQLDCSYDEFIALLSRAGLATPEASLKAPDENLRSKVDPHLADLGLTVDKVYQDARAGRTFLARTLWATMRDAPEFPQDASADYDSLHYSFEFLGIAPGSPEMCALLETTPEQFRRVDQKYAKESVYEDLLFRQSMMNFAMMKTMSPGRPDVKLSDLFKTAREYDEMYDRNFADFEQETAKTIKRSGLSEAEMTFYILARLEGDGRLPGADPRTPLN